MEKRSLFSKIFGNRVQKQFGQQLQLLNGYQAQFTNYDGNIYASSIIRSCIDTIARNVAKLNPKHVRVENGKNVILKDNINKLISKKPNELDNAYNFYYKIISILYLNNNSYTFIVRDEYGNAVGLYPIKPQTYRLLEYQDNVYIQFSFVNGQKYTASLKDDVIHLKRFYCEDDIVGGSNEPIIKAMSFKHVMDEGIVNAIKTTSAIKGILKSTKAMLKPEDVKAFRDTFVNDFINDNTGIGGLDATTDFKEVNLNPTTASDSQVSQINKEVHRYYGVNEKILDSSYNEDEWNAFYESVIEPLLVQMSLEFTNKIFSPMEIAHGNEIVFDSNRMQYASVTSKINLVKELAPYGILRKGDIREIFNLPPGEDDDVIMQSLNMIDSSKANEYQVGGNENE